MSVNLRSVLISDPVDEQCAALLTSHGVSVTKKYKLSKEELIKELEVSIEQLAQVSYFSCCDISFGGIRPP